MKSFRVEIAPTNKSLARFLTARYEKSVTPITYGELRDNHSANLAGAFAILYQTFSGNPIQDDTQVFSVKSEQSAFKRFYGPSICRSTNGELILLMGTESIPLELSKGAFVTKGLPDGMEIDFGIAEEKVGDFKETILKISIYVVAQELLLVYPISLRLSATEDPVTGEKTYPGVDTLEQLFLRAPDKFKKAVGDVPNINQFDGPLIKLKQLHVGETYNVIGYRAVKPAGRLSFILAITKTNPSQTYTDAIDPSEEHDFQQAEVWANSVLQAALVNNPTINPESPATLLIRGMRETKQGTTSVDCALLLPPSENTPKQLEEELIFDF